MGKGKVPDFCTARMLNPVPELSFLLPVSKVFGPDTSAGLPCTLSPIRDQVPVHHPVVSGNSLRTGSEDWKGDAWTNCTSESLGTEA